METVVLEKFRPCGDCSECCSGALIGNSHGNRFGHGRACVFLVNKTCSIYKHRPQACQTFQCGWSQHILPESLKPNKCGVLVSVETDTVSNLQYLKVIEIRPIVEYWVYLEIDKFCKENNTYYIKVSYESNFKHT